MNNEELRTGFHRDGWVVIRQFLPAGEFDELRGQLQRYIAEIVPTLPDTHAFFEDRRRPETLKQLQHMDVDPYFRDYVRHRRWVSLARWLLGEEVNALGTEWFNKPAGTDHPTPPHQDNYYFNLTPPHVLTMWLALADVDEQNGCLRYVSGSHRNGRRPHSRSRVLGFSQQITDYGPQDVAHEVPVAMQANDLAVHHGWTVHRASPNRSATRNRPSFAIVYHGVSCQVDQEGLRRYQQDLTTQHKSLGLKQQ